MRKPRSLANMIGALAVAWASMVFTAHAAEQVDVELVFLADASLSHR